MALFPDLIAAAQFRADLQNSARVSQAEWVSLIHEAILSAWHLASSARPDFQVKSADFALTNGNSASFVVPPDFYDEVDLVFGPDTVNEYSLGPFAWQNRRAPGSWLPPFVTTGAGGTRARLQGQTMYVEPSLRAAGSYRLWYCPQPRTCRFIVRLATAAVLPPVTASGSGVGKQLVASSGPGALSVDGVAVVAGDRILVKNQILGVDNGIYVVANPGDGISGFSLVRASDFDQTADGVYAGVCVMPTEGTANTNTFFELVTFGSTGLGAIDVDSMLWGASNGTDPVLTPFEELIKVKAAIPAVVRDDRNPANLQNDAAALAAQLTTFFRQVRTSNVPQKVVDTDMIGPRWFGGSW